MPERIGLGPRAAALALDGTVVLLVSFLFGPWLGIRLGLGQVGGLGPGAGGMMAGAAGGTALLVLLYFAAEAVWDASPGKRLLGLCVRDGEGWPPPPAIRAARWALKTAPATVWLLSVIVSVGWPGLGSLLESVALFVAVLLAVGTISALRPARQALHDRLTGTAVYRRADVPDLSDEEDEPDEA